jgi:DNA-binding FrmR family transcriptional regulator
VAERPLVDQARTRLRRIEGQVRGIQGMLDRMGEDTRAQDALHGRVRELLAGGASQAQAARTLGISRKRVADIASGCDDEICEPCDGLLTQLLAVRAAVEQVGLIVMELHLQRCVLGDLPADEARLRELRESLRLWSRLA